MVRSSPNVGPFSRGSSSDGFPSAVNMSARRVVGMAASIEGLVPDIDLSVVIRDGSKDEVPNTSRVDGPERRDGRNLVPGNAFGCFRRSTPGSGRGLPLNEPLIGVWPADPSPDHLGAPALDGD